MSVSSGQWLRVLKPDERGNFQNVFHLVTLKQSGVLSGPLWVSVGAQVAVSGDVIVSKVLQLHGSCENQQTKQNNKTPTQQRP